MHYVPTACLNKNNHLLLITHRMSAKSKSATKDEYLVLQGCLAVNTGIPVYGLIWSDTFTALDGDQRQLVAMAQGNTVSYLERKYERSSSRNKKKPKLDRTKQWKQMELLTVITKRTDQVEVDQEEDNNQEEDDLEEDDPEEEKPEVLAAIAFFGKPNRLRIVTGGETGTLFLMKIPGISSNRMRSSYLTGPGGSITEIKQSPTHIWFVIVAYDNCTCGMWDLHHKNMVAAFTTIQKAHDSGLSSLDFHSTGDLLVTATDDNIINIWKCDDVIEKYLAHDHTIRWKGDEAVNSPYFSADLSQYAHVEVDDYISGIDCVLFCGHDDWIITSSKSKCFLWKWDPTIPSVEGSGKNQGLVTSAHGVTIVAQFSMKHVKFTHTKFHLSHECLAIGNGIGQVFVWKLSEVIRYVLKQDIPPNKTIVRHGILHMDHQTTVRNVQFSPDGKLLAATCDDGTFGLFNIGLSGLSVLDINI